LAIKRLVWDKYIGECIGKSKCYCCKLTDIVQMSFHCGHVIAEKNGGSIEITNLRPICQICNSSMGTTNMDVFVKSYKIENKDF
jgi:5-methylcytosine-specific restriction endonuclease McrA